VPAEAAHRIRVVVARPSRPDPPELMMLLVLKRLEKPDAHAWSSRHDIDWSHMVTP
jgi:hypothetical protein